MRKPPFIRTPYNYDTEQASNETAYVERLPSLTIQSQSLDTDINEIVRRVGIGAPMPTNYRLPQYGDYSEIGDFRSAIEAVKNAEMNFMQLPAAIRANFQNDPQAFLDFCVDANPANQEQLIQWGLATRRQETIAAPGAPNAPQAPETAPGAPANEPAKK